MSKTRITLTLDRSIVDKLPKQNKSAFVDLILKQHFQSEGADKLYNKIKQLLLNDIEFNDFVMNKAFEAISETQKGSAY